MKIVCDVSVGNRLQPSSKPRKHAKSTLALCKRPNSDDFYIILFTAQNKSGAKYNVKGNLKQVLTKFLKEGKCTIRFVTPEHDLYISCDTIPLKGFLRLLKRVVDNKVKANDFSVSSVGITAVRPQDIAPKKLVITKRSEYPSKGFPRTLEELRINEISRCSVDVGIFQLSKLKILDLSSNNIEFIPEELSTLPKLKELNLSRNHLHKAAGRWNWMRGNLSNSLLLLDLSYNELAAIPKLINKLHKLQTLNLSFNALRALPTNLGTMISLKTFSASNNNLISLPGSIRNLRLQSIDLSHNNFKNHTACPLRSKPAPLQVRSLKDCACQKVIRARLPYPPGSVPTTLINYLDQGSFCVCGKAIFGNVLQGSYVMRLAHIAENVYTAVGDEVLILVDGKFCSKYCYKLTMQTRLR